MEAPEPDEEGTPEEGFIFVLEKATLETAKVARPQTPNPGTHDSKTLEH